MDGTTDTNYGFDRSDNQAIVNPIQVSDKDGGVGSVAAKIANRVRDFDFANKIYAQAGLSIIAEGAPRAATKPGPWPITAAQRTALIAAGTGRSPNATTMNMYYVKSLDPAANGVTRPAFSAGQGSSFVVDNDVANTFAHELGHQFLNANSAFHMNDAGTPSESDDKSNLMYLDGSQSSTKLSDVGPVLSPTVGGHDILVADQIDRIFANAGANNPGYVQKSHHAAAGDRVDWNFVADQTNLEGRANGADYNPLNDSLYFGIGTTVAPSQVGQNHEGFDEFKPTPDFAGPSFRTVDVFSLITRYADQDVTKGGGISYRNQALDYDLYFRAADGSTVAGIPIMVFKDGWTFTNHADDYLARWVSPVPAVGVFIFAHSGDGHDGNAQIDAVIASATLVPEPAAFGLAIVGTFILGLYRPMRLWRRHCTGK
jgi:hypothetical protein